MESSKLESVIDVGKQKSSLTNASRLIEKLSSLVGQENLEINEDISQKYKINTLGRTKKICGVISVSSRNEVQKVVRLANIEGMTLYPISTGKNWGYGCSTPVSDNCWILNLSKLNKIIDFNHQLGYVQIEPGVTQQDLYNFLGINNSSYMVPTTGAGPECSVLANALERGYGITPNTDHFLAVNHMEILLPSGEISTGLLSEMGNSKVDHIFKWGLGPYLNGLFTQSNFGIVLSATVQLVKRPEKITSFFFKLNDSKNLAPVLEGIKAIKAELGGLCSGINLMNDRRVLSMSTFRDCAPLDQDGIIDQEWIKRKAKASNAGEWNGLGSCYISKDMEPIVKKVIKKHLKKHVDSLMFFDKNKLQLAKSFLSFFGAKRLFIDKIKAISTLLEAQQILKGKPSRVALPLAYWLNKRREPHSFNPSIDNCGLIWYSPLVPNTSEDISQFYNMVNTVCRKHGVEPLITLTTINNTCFDSTIPILFDKQDKHKETSAHSCYEELLEEGQKLGYYPYRLTIDKIRSIDPKLPTARLLKKIKIALDPKNILSPEKFA